MSLDGVKLSVWDVGGHATLRDFWSNYYENANSLIYVIDAADEKRMQESGNVLMKLLAVIFTVKQIIGRGSHRYSIIGLRK
jgi:ADP-ribosylation factor-like protein 3